MQSGSTLASHLRTTRTENTTLRRMSPPLCKLLQDTMTDSRKLKQIASTYSQMESDADLTYEGFRLRLEQGRFQLNDLPHLCESMAVNGVDPAPFIATLEAACLPRDPELDGTMVTELCDMAASLGDFAETMKKHGHNLSDYPNEFLLELMNICGRSMAAARRLNQECLAAYE